MIHGIIVATGRGAAEHHTVAETTRGISVAAPVTALSGIRGRKRALMTNCDARVHCTSTGRNVIWCGAWGLGEDIDSTVYTGTKKQEYIN